MTKLRKKLTEKTRKFGAEVRRRHSTGLTPESEARPGYLSFGLVRL